MTEGKLGAFELQAVARETPHICNAWCGGGVHARPLYTDGYLPENTTAIITGGVRHEIVRFAMAPELPPVDPTDPEGREWPFGYIAWEAGVGYANESLKFR